MWVAEAEGVKFRMQVIKELKSRGVSDIFTVCVDGSKGFPKSHRIGVPGDACIPRHDAPSQAVTKLRQ
jgi:putative transposase